MLEDVSRCNEAVSCECNKRLSLPQAQMKHMETEVAATWDSVRSVWEKASLLKVFVALSGDPKRYFLNLQIRWLRTTCHSLRDQNSSCGLCWYLCSHDKTISIIWDKNEYFKSVMGICKITYNLVFKLNVLKFYYFGCLMIDTWQSMVIAFCLQDEQNCLNCQVYFGF